MGWVGIMARPVELLALEPFDKFIASELEIDAGCVAEEGANVDVDLSVGGIAYEIELLVVLDVEISHILSVEGRPEPS